MSRLAILGAGSWGTALAIVLAPRFDEVRLWAHDPGLAARLAEERCNATYLPGFTLPVNVQPTAEIESCAPGAEFVLGVIPSEYAAGLYSRIGARLNAGQIFISATKGIQIGTLQRMSEVVRGAAGETQPLAILSGPTFAREVAAGEPAAIVIASRDRSVAAAVQARFSTPSFRLYTNTDEVGVEVGAALKNVIAIAAGVVQGLGLGNNSLAALIARGLAEITRLAVAMGGRPETLAGLAGLGDLVLTCTGDLSRNRKLGMELAKGRTLPSILAGTRMVAEGVRTTQAAAKLADLYRVEMPITREMELILGQGKPPRDAIRDLMERSLKEE